MSNDMDKLKEQIQSQLEAEGYVVFQGYSRSVESGAPVHWDSHHYPDFRLYLETAKKLDVRLIVFHHRELDSDFIDDVLADLDVADLPGEERQRLIKRLGEFRVWEGFTSAVELSYTYQNQIYVFVQRAEWYEEIIEIADEIEDYLAGEEIEEDSPDAMGGFFSRN